VTTQEYHRKPIVAVLEAQGEQMKGTTLAFVYQIAQRVAAGGFGASHRQHRQPCSPLRFLKAALTPPGRKTKG